MTLRLLAYFVDVFHVLSVQNVPQIIFHLYQMAIRFHKSEKSNRIQFIKFSFFVKLGYLLFPSGCNAGTYGSECELTCGRCSEGQSVCDTTSGHCPDRIPRCMLGYSGLTCGTGQCHHCHTCIPLLSAIFNKYSLEQGYRHCDNGHKVVDVLERYCKI